MTRPAAPRRSRCGWRARTGPLFLLLLLLCALPPLSAVAAAAEDAALAPVTAAAQPDTTTSSLIALGALGGHLRVVVELCRDGRADLAAEEVAADTTEGAALAGDLAKRGRPDLAPPLAAFRSAVQTSAPMGAVEAAHETLAEALQDDRAALAPSPQQRFDAMVALMRQAAAAYAEGVRDGTLADATAYRRAWGLVQAVRAMADALVGSSTDAVDSAAFDAEDALGRASDAFPGLVPRGRIQADPKLMPQIVARIEAARKTLD